jgi:hypothetical protein
LNITFACRSYRSTVRGRIREWLDASPEEAPEGATCVYIEQGGLGLDFLKLFFFAFFSLKLV